MKWGFVIIIIFAGCLKKEADISAKEIQTYYILDTSDQKSETH